MLNPGEVKRTKLPDSMDGIRFTAKRMIYHIKDAWKDPLVISTARKIAALSITSRKPKNAAERDLIVLKGIHAWCKANFVYVDDPVNVELIQTPNRMLRELQIPPQLHMLMWKPIGKALGGKLPRPRIAGDSDEASILGLALAGAVGMNPLRIKLGGHDGTLHYAWGGVWINDRWYDLDILHPKFNGHPDFTCYEDLEV